MQQTVGLIAILLSLFSCSLAQSKPKVGLDIGSVTIYLGMPRDEIIKKCASAGYKQFVVDKDTIAFQDGGDFSPYTVQFRNDQVVYADREWFLAKGDLDAFESAIAALGSLADNEKSPLCIISHVLVRKPDRSLDNIVLSCGQRTITLVRGKFNDRDAKTFYGVEEQIGEMQPSK